MKETPVRLVLCGKGQSGGGVLGQVQGPDQTAVLHKGSALVVVVVVVVVVTSAVINARASNIL